MAEERRLNIRPICANPVVDGASDTKFGFLIKDAQKEVDLTGYTAKMEIRPYAGSVRVYDTLTTENGRLVIDGGTVQMIFPADITKDYQFTRARYDLMVISPDGLKYRVVEGDISFRAGITR